MHVHRKAYHVQVAAGRSAYGRTGARNIDTRGERSARQVGRLLQETVQLSSVRSAQRNHVHVAAVRRNRVQPLESHVLRHLPVVAGDRIAPELFEVRRAFRPGRDLVRRKRGAPALHGLAALHRQQQKARHVARSLYGEVPLAGKVNVEFLQHLRAEVVQPDACHARRERRAHAEHRLLSALVQGVGIVAPNRKRLHRRTKPLDLQSVNVGGDRFAPRRELHLAVADGYVVRRKLRIAAKLVGMPPLPADDVLDRHALYRRAHDLRIGQAVARLPLVVGHDLENRALRARGFHVPYGDVAHISSARGVRLYEQHAPDLTLNGAVLEPDVLDAAGKLAADAEQRVPVDDRAVAYQHVPRGPCPETALPVPSALHAEAVVALVEPAVLDQRPLHGLEVYAVCVRALAADVQVADRHVVGAEHVDRPVRRIADAEAV